MKKVLFFVVLLAVLSFSTSLFAKDKGFYIGVGGSYAYEDFDVKDKDPDELHVGLDYEDTMGINLKAGYHFNRLFALEINFDYLPGFEAEGSIVYSGVPIDVDVDVDVMTYMLAAKVSPGFGSDIIRPFVVAGFGFATADVDATATATVSGKKYSSSASDSETDLCTKLGLGIDFYINEHVSVGLEGSYTWGLGDLDEGRYINSTLGLAYHF
jgi:opacity protein-like surface antigen